MNSLIKNLGELAVASRLRILSERLLHDVSKIYHEQNLDFESRWFLIFYQLMLKSPMFITEIAEALSITHPAVNQLAGEMLKAGIIKSSSDKTDRRRRLLSLSKKGEKMLPIIKPIWEDIENATSELIHSTSDNFLFILEKIENSLNKKNMYSRVNEKIRQRIFENIEILEYKPEYKKYFKKINYEWLKKYFSIESIDKEILSDPENKIIRKGGYIFFAKYCNNIVGTCALLKYNEKIYELVKMGVIEKYQNKQIGRKLTLTAIEKAKNLGADYIYLTTHIRLIPATNLYKKLGFELAKPLQKIVYERKGITMRLDLKKINPN